jgi:hypothetical protein
MSPEMMVNESDSDVEAALEAQCMNLQQRSHDNARWWRNLNRWMISLGVVITVVIVSLPSGFGVLDCFFSNYLADHSRCYWLYYGLLSPIRQYQPTTLSPCFQCGCARLAIFHLMLSRLGLALPMALQNPSF